jgi:YggT family protein
MFVFAEFFRALEMLVSGVFFVLYWLIIIRIVLTWLPIDPYHSFVQFLIQATDPVLRPFRRLPLTIGMIDLSPFVAIITLYFVRNVLIECLQRLAQAVS